MQTVKFISLPEAEEYSPSFGQHNRILISLTTPQGFKHHPNSRYCRLANLKEGVWKEVLRIQFHDADPGHMNSEEACGYKLFSEADAVNIIQFLKRNEGVDHCFVHCEAGISRSAGVAKFVANVFNLEFPDSYSLYNKHVFSTLMKAYGSSLYGDGPIAINELPMPQGAQDA